MAISTKGYCQEIDWRQDRHFAPKIIKLRTGILSNQRIAALQVGQCDPGKTIEESGSGSRKITTLRKLPTMAPKIIAIIEKKALIY